MGTLEASIAELKAVEPTWKELAGKAKTGKGQTEKTKFTTTGILLDQFTQRANELSTKVGERLGEAEASFNAMSSAMGKVATSYQSEEDGNQKTLTK